MSKPKLRDSRSRKYNEPFPLNEIPNSVIQEIGKSIIYLISIGKKDITGDDWGDILSSAINGEHLASPLGIADVVLNGMAWSTKTVKHLGKKGVFDAKKVSLISGRCSPDYSYGITDPHVDVQRTGDAVLGIWNERVNIAQEKYTPVRTSVLVRSPDLLSYILFEEENHRFRISDYEWKVNDNGNLKGFRIGTDEPIFTWQPHGSQFTIHVSVPQKVKKFKLKQPPILSKSETLKALGFNSSWIDIID